MMATVSGDFPGAKYRSRAGAATGPALVLQAEGGVEAGARGPGGHEPVAPGIAAIEEGGEDHDRGYPAGEDGGAGRARGGAGRGRAGLAWRNEEGGGQRRSGL